MEDDLFGGAIAPPGPARPRPATAEVFGGATDLHPFMGWIEIPSDDHRRRRATRRTI